MGPTVGSPDFDSARMNDALERFLYQSHETIRDPLLKWVEAFDVASASIPELTKLGHESERQADKVRKAELSFRKRFYAASGGGAATDPPSSIIGSCMKFFSCKSRSKSMDDLRVTRPDLSVLVEGEAGDLTAVQRGAPIALELKEDEASLQLREEIRKLETTANAYDAMESNLNESFAGLCEDSAWLKSYMTSQLMLLKDLLQESLIFLGPSLPLSTALGPCSDPANSNLLTTGVTSKEDLIAGMPSFLNDLKLRSSIIEGSLGQRVNKNVSPLAKATSSKAGPLHRTSNITPRSSDLDD